MVFAFWHTLNSKGYNFYSLIDLGTKSYNIERSISSFLTPQPEINWIASLISSWLRRGSNMNSSKILILGIPVGGINQ